MEDKWKLQEQKFDEQYFEYLELGGTKTRENWFSDLARDFNEAFSGMNDMEETGEHLDNLK